MPHRWGLGIRRESLPPTSTHLDLNWTRVSSWLSRNGEKGSGLDSNAMNSALSYQIFVGFSFKKMFFLFTCGLTIEPSPKDLNGWVFKHIFTRFTREWISGGPHAVIPNVSVQSTDLIQHL